MAGASTQGNEAARKVLHDMAFPFDAGDATNKFVEILHIVHRHLFHRPRELPVPTSLLIDAEGHLAAIYRGPFSIDVLMRDVANLGRAKSSSPVAGRWMSPPQPTRLSPIAWKLLEKGFTAQGIKFVETNIAQLEREPNSADLLTQTGTELIKQGKWRAAAERFERVLKTATDNRFTLNNLAWIMATAEDARLRDGPRAVLLAEKALRLSTDHKANAQETLAAAYAEAGRFDDALRTARAALATARNMGDNSFVKQLSLQISFYQSRRPYRVDPKQR
jgi:tetratricopeptide (TPR) repeat protein